MRWRLNADKTLDLAQPRVLAILNVTPDSFADGGTLTSPARAADAAEQACAAGADALDIGGESTRPGAAPVSDAEQIARVVPAITAIRSRGGVLSTIPITIDTTRLAVARAAFDAGADALNDVSAALDDPGVLDLCAREKRGVILMHRVRPPRLDRFSDQYGTSPPIDGPAYALVRDALADAKARALAAGLVPESIVLDPGLGFGKSVEQNLELIHRTPDLMQALGTPILSGISRKSFVGRVSLRTDSTPDQRLEGTLALSVLHLVAGARLFRVHDVIAHVRALRAAWAWLEHSRRMQIKSDMDVA